MTPAKKEPNMETFAGRFAARLRELRERAGLSRADVANAVGVAPSAISNWENAISFPSVEKFPQIAAALKTSVRNVLPKE